MDSSYFFRIFNEQNIFNQLGTTVANGYVPYDNCYQSKQVGRFAWVALSYIYDKLNTEDNNAIEYRQIIGFSQVVKKNLIPMLITINNDKTLELLIKILANIMSPSDALMAVRNGTEDGNRSSTVFKLNWLLAINKVECANMKAFTRIVHIIKENLMKLSSFQEYIMNQHHVIINDCLCLIKNILRVPNNAYQDQILRMLFSEQFDEILIDLIVNTNRRHWAVHIVELIALIFKDQHVDQMSQMLTNMYKAMNSGDSEDNESNTSLPDLNDETSSSEENSIVLNSDEKYNDQHLNALQHKEILCDKNIILAYGERSSEKNVKANCVNHKVKTKYEFKDPTSLNLRCNIKSGENKLNFAQRSDSIQLRKNVPQEKIQPFIMINPFENNKGKSRIKKYKKKNLKIKLNTQFLSSYKPSQACISYFLQKFTVRFLQNGFNTLVDEFYNLYTSKSQKNIDTSHYFWLLTYFCRFFKICGVEMNLVKPVLSFKLVSFIIHEGIKISEEIMLARWKKSHDNSLQARHLHLVIMTIKEVIKTIEFYRQTTFLTPMYEELITHLRSSSNNSTESIIWAKDLKSIFVLLIHRYESKNKVTEYLRDLIVTNHMVLSLFDNLKDCWNLNDSITEHIKRFAAPGIMFKYGMVLTYYKINEEIINEAVFTMMHHIIGEVKNTTWFLQPVILKIFLKIFEDKESRLYEKWSDLIDFVRNNYLNLDDSSKHNLINEHESTPCL